MRSKQEFRILAHDLSKDCNINFFRLTNSPISLINAGSWRLKLLTLDNVPRRPWSTVLELPRGLMPLLPPWLGVTSKKGGSFWW